MSGDFSGWLPPNSVNKTRIVIPAEFKKKFDESANRMVVVTLGPEGTVAVFPKDTWLLQKESLQAQATPEAGDILATLEHFAMTEQELEGPGRIRVREDLLKIAGITDKVIVQGAGHFIILWSPERHQEVSDQLLQPALKLKSTAFQIKNV